MLVVHRGHPFAASGQIRMARDGHRASDSVRPDQLYHELTSAIFRQAGIDPRGYLEVDNIDAAKRMVEQRLGIALLPRTSVQAEIGTGGFPVAVIDMSPVRRQIVVARRRDVGDVSPVLAAFLATLDTLLAGRRPGASVPGRGRFTRLRTTVRRPARRTVS